jgi:hypothetical protein
VAAGAGRAAGVDDSVVFVERGGEMSAQEKWKNTYRHWIDGWYLPEYDAEIRSELRHYRREAALERQLAAAQREIKRHIMRINGVIRYINDGEENWKHVENIETEEPVECEHCRDEWPCQYDIIMRALLGLDDDDIVQCGVPSDRIEIDTAAIRARNEPPKNDNKAKEHDDCL